VVKVPNLRISTRSPSRNARTMPSRIISIRPLASLCEFATARAISSLRSAFVSFAKEGADDPSRRSYFLPGEDVFFAAAESFAAR